MTLPRLPREPIRPELEDPNLPDKEIWQPTWRCFCCQDTGLVHSDWLVKLVVPDYDSKRDKLIACQHPRCEAGWNYRGDENYDQRFLNHICVELDRLCREDWKRTILAQWKRAKENPVCRIKQLGNKMSLRKRERTPTEDKEAQRRHKESCNADPEKLREKARAYLGDEYMKDGPS